MLPCEGCGLTGASIYLQAWGGGGAGSLKVFQQTLLYQFLQIILLRSLCYFPCNWEVLPPVQLASIRGRSLILIGETKSALRAPREPIPLEKNV